MYLFSNNFCTFSPLLSHLQSSLPPSHHSQTSPPPPLHDQCIHNYTLNSRVFSYVPLDINLLFALQLQELFNFINRLFNPATASRNGRRQREKISKVNPNKFHSSNEGIFQQFYASWSAFYRGKRPLVWREIYVVLLRCRWRCSRINNHRQFMGEVSNKSHHYG